MTDNKYCHAIAVFQHLHVVDFIYRSSVCGTSWVGGRQKINFHHAARIVSSCGDRTNQPVPGSVLRYCHVEGYLDPHFDPLLQRFSRADSGWDPTGASVWPSQCHCT